MEEKACRVSADDVLSMFITKKRGLHRGTDEKSQIPSCNDGHGKPFYVPDHSFHAHIRTS